MCAPAVSTRTSEFSRSECRPAALSSQEEPSVGSVSGGATDSLRLMACEEPCSSGRLGLEQTLGSIRRRCSCLTAYTSADRSRRSTGSDARGLHHSTWRHGS
jgi:hypothetical protein